MIVACLCTVTRISELEMEQNIKFFVKLGKNGNELKGMLVQIDGKNSMKKKGVNKFQMRQNRR